MPSGFSVIVLPTDLSEPPGEAFALARSLAGLGARLIVVHVDGPRTPDADPPAPGCTRQAAPIDPPGTVRVEHTTRHGPAADSIVGFAEEVGCDLIVIGTPGDAGFGRLTGEIAQDVLRRAACPVLCLPASGRQETVSEHPRGCLVVDRQRQSAGDGGRCPPYVSPSPTIP